jgi:uncharacterized protein YbjT (DUF2867 family)
MNRTMSPLPANALVTVFGGSGFIGRHLVRRLAKAGHRVRVAVRRPDLAGHLQPLGGVGQIAFIQANLRYPESIQRAVEGADAVVNAVGILYESGRQSFNAVQAQGPRMIAEAAARNGVTRLAHVSAIGADRDSQALYAETKALGEAGVLAHIPGAAILRPSIVFGPEDNFFNQFGDLARKLPFLPLIGGGHTRFQPVFVGDVAEAIHAALDGKARPGAIYELGGPKVMTFRDILEYILKETGRSRALLPLPFGLAKLQASILQVLPKPLLTVDQVTMLETDNVVSEAAAREGRTLEGLGVDATAVEAIVPSYLYRFRAAGQFEKKKTAA